jgi:hypothetical protein
VFNELMPNVLQDLMKGINCTLFTYGQTGSGKTYTMQGPSQGLVSDSRTSSSTNKRGLIPRIVESIFQLCAKQQTSQHQPTQQLSQKKSKAAPQQVVTSSCEVFMSMLEIYQEKLFDLLATTTNTASTNGGTNTNTSSSSADNLRIREMGDGSIFVQGLSDCFIRDADSFQTLYAQGLSKRVTGSHAMNLESSRSHLVCILFIKQQVHSTSSSSCNTDTATNKTQGHSYNNKISSKIHLIDLAGSELVRKTGAEGTRLQEAKYINKSLSALGNVINALTNKKPGCASGSSSNGDSSLKSPVDSSPQSSSAQVLQQQQHIPYRDSKLTRVLQDSLRGNSRIVLIVTISSASEHTNETIATLRFGERAKKLTTKPKVNIELDDKEYKNALLVAQRKITTLTGTIVELQEELARMRQQQNQQVSAQAPVNQSVCSVCAGLPVHATSVHERAAKKFKPSEDNHEAMKLPPIHPNTASSLRVTTKAPRQAPAFSILRTTTSNGDAPLSDVADHDIDKESAANLGCETDDTRCAVCNLDERETEMLRRNTGEVLGSMFFCDGNCGQRFHVRCVGLVGEGGQFALPDGEWLCSECSVGVDAENAESLDDVAAVEGAVARTNDSSNFVSLQAVNNVDSKDKSGYESDRSAASMESVPTVPRLPSLSMSASVEADYHIMRRERNRILQQWQHEKKISALIADKRHQHDIERDRELVDLSNQLRTLSDDLLQKDVTLQIVTREKEDLFKRLNEALNKIGKPDYGRMDNDSDRSIDSAVADPSRSERNTDVVGVSISAGMGGPRLTLLSRSLDSKLDGYLNSDAASTSAASPSLDSTTPSTSLRTSLPGFDPLRAAAVMSVKASAATISSASSADSNGAAEIPKPWNKKKAVTSSSAKLPSGANNASISEKLALIATRKGGAVPSMVSDANQRKDKVGSSSSLLLPLLYENEDVSSTEHLHSSVAEGDPVGLSGEADGNSEDLLASAKDAYLVPLQSRLKGLLQAVKAETDSYTEIRMKQLEREEGRSSLRSRQMPDSQQRNGFDPEQPELQQPQRTSSVDRLINGKIRLNETLLMGQRALAAAGITGAKI